MNRTRDVAIAAAAAVAACLLLFPPFMTIDPAAADVRHAPLGHHPFWRPPTPDLAARALAGIPGPRPVGLAGRRAEKIISMMSWPVKRCLG